MRIKWPSIVARLRSKARAFGEGESGQIAIIFGVSITGVILAVGGGIDLSRAYQARQKLSEVATLACQYASRPSIIQYASPTYSGANGGATYTSSVNNFITASLTNQKFVYTQSNATPFTYTQSGPADVSLTANVPTAFMQIAQISQMPVSASSRCYDSPPSIQQTVPDGTSPNLVQEGFEAGCTNCVSYTRPNGTSGTTTVATSVIGSTPTYTGTTGNVWYATGYCLERDNVGAISATVPEGQVSAELDCDNNNGMGATAGNSAISTKVYLAAGNYELRYFYRSRVSYPNYDPAYICGSTASDVSWASDTNSQGGPVANALRTNQMNAYLDVNTTGTPPSHTTIDGAQQLSGSNLIDVCVYSNAWVERSVRIFVTNPAFYWLSFAADGQNDSYGAQLDNIRLCPKTCAGTVQDNFPASWLAANNGGVNKILFQDSFESPVYTQDPYTSTRHAKAGNLANSYGTVVTGGCAPSGGSPPGWPCQTSTGWATTPYNETWFWMQGATRGTQYFSLQGWSGFSTGTDPTNRAVSKKFLLDPGYYNVSYYYASLADFSYDFVYTNGYYNPPCRTGPTTPENLTTFGKKNGHVYGDPTTVYSQYLSTNFMTAYMANGQLISTPNINSTLGGAATYKNPDGTTTSNPTVPPDNGSIFNAYNTAASAVLDSCRYYSSFAWAARSVDIKISKPGYYWLTFSSQGDPLTASGMGPAIDDVKLTALGSLYMSSPPSSPVSIPVPTPQPSAQVSFTGFYIVADPLTPTAPLQ